MREQRGSIIDHLEFDTTKYELSYSLELVKELFDFLAFITKSKQVNYSKIRRESRVRIKLKSNYFSEIYSVSKGLVRGWSRALGLTAVPGLYSDLDITKDDYQGGFKVWEGTYDLIKFVNEDEDVLRTLMDRESTLRVLELGAGAGLASLALIGRLVYDKDFKQEYRVHLQDFNWEVLGTLTMLNFAANLPKTYLDALIHTRCLRFFFGDWCHFRHLDHYRYDLVIMSETLYEAGNFEAMHNLLDRHLGKNGYVIVATKDTYFGLSGGLYPWLDYVKDKGVFAHRVHNVSRPNIPRSILIMHRIND